MSDKFDKRFIGKILNSTVDAIIAINARGIIELYNDAAEKIFGYRRDEAIGSNVAMLMPEQDGRHHERYMMSYIDHGESKIIHAGPRELMGKHKDGRMFNIDLALNEMRCEGERYFVASLRDISDRKATEARLKNALKQLTKFRKAIDESSDGIFLIELPSQHIIDVNNTALSMLGYSRDELVNHSPQLVMPALDASSLDNIYRQILDDANCQKSIQTIQRDAQGVDIPVELCLSLIHEDSQSVIVVTSRDITERVKYERELESSKRLLLEAQHIGRFGSWEWNLSNDRLAWSEEVFHIFGFDSALYIPTHSKFLLQIHADDRQSVINGFNDAIKNEGRFSEEFRVLTQDGAERVIHLQAKTYLDTHREPSRMIGTMQDITERKNVEQRLEYLSNYDVLTGLPNRKLFRDRLEHAVLTARRKDSQIALIFMDLDQFKKVNDSLGHHVGDEMLKNVAQRIESALREGDTIARLGGDEFVIILEDVQHADNAAMVAEKVIENISQPLQIDNHELFPSASLGISVYPDDSSKISDLLKFSDLAMYSAKGAGRNTFRYYSQDLNKKALEHLTIEKNLHYALEKSEFYLVYQPQVCIETNRIVGLEALLRWMRPQDDQMSPAEFVPVLEESGMIHDVGEWVIRTVINQMLMWKIEGLPEMRVAINISSKQFKRSGFVGRVNSLIEESGIKPSLLEFEITESVLVEDVQQATQIMNELKKLGIRLSIDDFGTGYSSLSYLKKFPISTLKIDRSFINDVGKGKNGEAITDAIIAMGKALELNTIAEGVETSSQKKYLLDSGVNEVQGYYFSRPMTANNITKLYWRVEGDYERQILDFMPALQFC